MSTEVGLARENVGPLPNEIGAPGYTEEAGVLNALFASVLPATLAFGNPRSQRPRGRSGARKMYL